eukprot:444354_1
MAAHTELISHDEKYDIIDEICGHFRNILTKNQIEIFARIFENTNYNIDNFRDEICQAFEQDNTNKELEIYKILNNQLHLKRIKRQQIYDVVLHNYFNVINLNVDNIINLSQTFILQFKLDNIIDTKTFISIIRKNNLNGEALMNLKNAREFA